MAGVGEKLCVFCGKDCAGQPRGKDPTGRYYHTACYEGRQRASSSGGRGSGTSDGEYSMLNELIGATGAEAAPAPCPGCGQPMSGGALICTNCGYNAQTGGTMGVQVMSGPPSRGGSANWPVVVGAISIIIGLGGLGFAAMEALGGFVVASDDTFMSAMKGPGDPSYRSGYRTGLAAGALVRSTLLGLVACYAVVGGIGMLRRNKRLAMRLREWAIAKIPLTIMCNGGAIAAAASGSQIYANTDDALRRTALAIHITLMLGGLIWPIFVLTWLRRDAVKAEMNRW